MSSHLGTPAGEYDGSQTITEAIDVQAHFIADLLDKRNAAIAANDTPALRAAERVLQEITLYKTYMAMRVFN